MLLVKYLRHPPSDLGYQGLYLFLKYWPTIWYHFDNNLSLQDFPGPSEVPVADVGKQMGAGPLQMNKMSSADNLNHL